ncbi:PREDICTED: uncharacterized protein LOC107105578 [Gekko japonicus]|uniref:Uncharacterized protein LOC107105578 n=1 Tax=Gekko japonicus TaxID=146911 RepID=A0ABM1JHX7_GEKJA|nr:PREDICTED: uncharacterized protein LOC107105578 [Gekko japonicus]
METNSSVQLPAKRKASELHTDPSKDRVKASKHGFFVPTFKEIPNDPDFCATEGPAEPQGPCAPSCDDGPLDAGRGPNAASRVPQGQEAARVRDATPSVPRAPSHDDGRLDAGRGPNAAPRVPQGQEAARARDATPSVPRAPSRDDGRLDAGRGPNAASRVPQGQEAARARDATRSGPRAPSRDDGRPDAGRGQKAASRVPRGRGAARARDATRSGPRAPSRDDGRLDAGRGQKAAFRVPRGRGAARARNATPSGPHASSRDDRRLDAGRGRHAASRVPRGRGAGRARDATSSVSRGQYIPPSFRNRPGIPPSLPSQSQNNVIGRFFSSIRNMEVDEVADTLQKITETNPAFSAPVGPRKAVWIIGHSIVYSAGVYAASSGWGTALGLEDRLQVTWMGNRGMKWDDLLPAVSLQVSLQGSPDALVIQLGENDLLERKGVDLNIAIAADLHTLVSRLPNTRFFWSDLLERREWPAATTAEKGDLVRRNVTAAAGRLIEATGGVVIRHPDINFKQTALFRSDGINLSEWGMDIWLHSIRYGLLCWLQS